MLPKKYAVLLMAALGVGCATGPPSGVAPVTGFNVNRYLGTWYEIARLDHSFERGLSRVTAEYALNDNGTIKVLNRGYNAEKDTWESAEGKAKFRGDPTVGSLKVSFFGPFYGGYHIFELDEDYQYAMVAGPSKNYLWILARAPELDDATYQGLVSMAADLGFPTDELIRVEHDFAEAPAR
jgi:apolipoprotein D and lipocalin family protein